MYGIYSPPLRPYKPKTDVLSRYCSSSPSQDMETLAPPPTLLRPIRRLASQPMLNNVYHHRPAIDAFLMAGPLPTLVSTSENRIAVMAEEDGESHTTPPRHSRRVHLADASIFTQQEAHSIHILPPILITASTSNDKAMQLGDLIRLKHSAMSAGGWVTSVSLEQPGWLVAIAHGWVQSDGEPNLSWGMFQLITRRKWMKPYAPDGPRCPKRFLIDINRRIQAEPVTGLLGWMFKFMDSNVGM
jgi:hypothetical protein